MPHRPQTPCADCGVARSRELVHMGGTRRYRMAVCAECGIGELVGQPGRCYHVVRQGTDWYVAST